MIKALIVEDELPAMEHLKMLIHKSYPSLEIVGTAQDATTAKEMIISFHPDIVFLDIELPDYNGFSLLEQCKHLHFEVIFITAFSTYAAKAFEYFALGYLIKPIEAEQLKRTIDIAIQRLQQQEVNNKIEMMLQMVRTQNDLHKSISLPTINGFELVHSDDIIYCRSEGNYTVFYLKDKRNIMVSKQLGVYEKILPKQAFIRIHSQYIINAGFVMKYSKGTGGLVTLSNGEELPVSANRKHDFLERFTS